MSTPDRRIRRSPSPQVATRYCLQSLTRRHRLTALVVADEHGRLVAGAEGEPCGAGFLAHRVAEGFGQSLAAQAAEVFRRPRAEPDPRFEAPVLSTPIFLGARRYYLVAVGEPEAAAAATLEAAPALQRILAPLTPPAT